MVQSISDHRCLCKGKSPGKAYVEHIRNSPKLNVFQLQGVRPLFFSRTMLEQWLMPQLKSDVAHFIYQQDGAPPYFNIRTFLNGRLPNRWIGRVGRDDIQLLSWPPRSPDLTPCDFYLWGHVKSSVFVPPLPENLPELRARIIIPIAAIDMDTLSRVWDEYWTTGLIEGHYCHGDYDYCGSDYCESGYDDCSGCYCDGGYNNCGCDYFESDYANCGGDYCADSYDNFGDGYYDGGYGNCGGDYCERGYGNCGNGYCDGSYTNCGRDYCAASYDNFGDGYYDGGYGNCGDDYCESGYANCGGDYCESGYGNCGDGYCKSGYGNCGDGYYDGSYTNCGSDYCAGKLFTIILAIVTMMVVMGIVVMIIVKVVMLIVAVIIVKVVMEIAAVIIVRVVMIIVPVITVRVIIIILAVIIVLVLTIILAMVIVMMVMGIVAVIIVLVVVIIASVITVMGYMVSRETLRRYATRRSETNANGTEFDSNECEENRKHRSLPLPRLEFDDTGVKHKHITLLGYFKTYAGVRRIMPNFVMVLRISAVSHSVDG
ncbi:hypothetical protein ANN_08524 [Periplaneta americana]|uniref:Uncharacterized protein n=1 Tax=Periplaneta americana TaxID=6978 RepID=A0ABQ8T1P3_PERAM|nr:hypothetical protein ANN_08524 [Periplaneta americana]